MPIHLSRRLFIASGLACTATASAAQTQAYDVAPKGSRIAFIFTASGTAQTGTVPVATADIEIDTRTLANSRAEVTADIRKIKTGFIFMTNAIKSPDLLDAATYPLVQFKSKRVRLGADGRISQGAQIEGDLTLRGITRPISFDALLSRPTGSAPDDLSTLNIQLNGKLSRREFGALGFPGLAEDTVALDIKAELRART
ncbi:MAG: YceI family protein [Roseobacter sp.]